jgi:hypothetical protein
MLYCEKQTFSIQIDEATYCNRFGNVIAYVQYIKDATINKDMLFCKPIKEE